ncbi:MAG: type I restriction enzyme HsdR N-terminal domain-containing protein [Muribaculaceae bacterium]|nr:type I restriction enzyme HsdR N-terminal domain-containing protein [Muribaculaceae bacterium]
MQKLNLPEYSDVRICRDGDALKIFDRIRKKFVALTPEEWVRQNFVNHLIENLGYPESLIANEHGIELNGTSRRCDTVVFDRYGLPAMIVEYKAPTVNITQDVFDQIVRYNLVLHARFLIVSNGLTHYCCQIDPSTGAYTFLPSIPDYEAVKGS